MKMSARLAVALLILVLPSCGGSSNSPAAPPPTPAPTPTPISHTGFFTGPMAYNPGTGGGVLNVTGSIAIVHAGNEIQFGNGLRLTIPGSPTTVTILLGSGTLVGDTAIATTSYTSSGCGTITSRTTARFGGRQMNLTVELTSPSCAPSRAVGELSR